MRKMDVRHGIAQTKSAERRGKGESVELPQRENVAQLETAIDGNSYVGKLAQLAAIAEAGSTSSAQRGLVGLVHNSPRMAAQRKAIEGICSTPYIVAQRRRLDSLSGTVQREGEPAMQMKAGALVNDGAGLMGQSWAVQMMPRQDTRLAPGRLALPSGGLVAQCVGGEKFGMEVTGDGSNDVVAEGIEKLREIQKNYKAEIKTSKDAARQTFEQGDKSDQARQTTYSDALANAEMTPGGLLGRLTGGLTNVGDTISYNGVEIAKIKRGVDAYVLHQAANPGANISAIYKRHTLDGSSEQEYVSLNGQMLRRYAFRGITPSERAAYKAGGVLKPMSVGHETEGLTGYKFSASGTASKRKHDLLAEPPKETDLEWLNSKTGKNLGAVPDNLRLLAFLQTRKGVGKLLSATSTPKSITSNHGEAFTGFGNIKIDLARVSSANVAHHYKQAPFDASALNQPLGGGIPSGALSWETDRANETVRRNREIVLKEIPAAAVAGLTESPDRIAYETEFKKLYAAAYKEGYDDALGASSLNLEDMAPPPPTVFPWVESHYTKGEATKDFNPFVAKQSGREIAAPRIAFGEAYVAAYQKLWREKYLEAVEDAFYDVHPEDVFPGVDEPELPSVKDIAVPQGLDILDAKKRGGAAGSVAGKTAGGG